MRNQLMTIGAVVAEIKYAKCGKMENAMLGNIRSRK